MTEIKKGTIISHRTRESIDTLKAAGFKVVGVRKVSTLDPWGFQITWQEVDLAKGKIACYVRLEGEVEIEKELPYELREDSGPDHRFSLAELLELPEETVEEREERERQEIIDARHVSADGKTFIYVVPVGTKVYFEAPEANAIVCKPTDRYEMGGDPHYDVIGLSHEQVQEVKSESAQGWSTAPYGRGICLHTLESRIPEVVRKLTA